MCGRYTLTASGEELSEAFELSEIPRILTPRFNIAPTQQAPVVRVLQEESERRLDPLRWGLIPAWASDPSIGDRMINARSESAADKPAFRTAIRCRRCLVPCTGFYEWAQPVAGATRKGRKQPYYIRRRDERVFALAGLWERWKDPDGEVIDSYVILTTEPNELVRPLHNRMPVILRPADYGLWLNAEVNSLERLKALLRPYLPDDLTAYAVSTHVNSPTNDDTGCVRPL